MSLARPGGYKQCKSITICQSCGSDNIALLTPQMVRALIGLTQAMRKERLAAYLGITSGGAQELLGRVYQSIGVHSQLEAALWAIKHKELLEKAAENSSAHVAIATASAITPAATK